MAVFSERHTGYKVGVVLFCIGVIAFIVGFASPYWTWSRSRHNGLWETCLEENLGSICSSLVGDNVEKEEWYGAVEALQCLALVGFSLAGCYGVYVNWCAKSRVFNRRLECVVGFSAVIGFVGAIIFAAKQAKKQERIDDLSKEVARYGETLIYEFEPVAWSFIVDIIGCLLAIVAAVLVAVFNKPLPADPPSSTFQPIQPGTTFAPGSTYANASPASAPYIVTYAASPYNQGQPVAVGDGSNPPPYQPPMNSQSSVVATGGPSTGGAGPR